MQRRKFLKTAGGVGLIAMIDSHAFAGMPGENIDALEQYFQQPPHDAQPQVIWFWMNGHISKEGITLDLEAMKQIGIGGVFNFDADQGIPKGPVTYLSAAWLELKKHAVAEAARLGLDFTIHNCPGWSASGGPWITPELAMQQITWSETFIEGGKEINIELEKPVSRLNYYKDVAVLAFPSLQGEAPLPMLLSKATSGNGIVDPEQLKAENRAGVTVQPVNDQQAWLQFEFKESYEVRCISFFISAVGSKEKPTDFGKKTSLLFESSNDGIQFNLVTSINTGFEAGLIAGNKFITYDVPPTKAKYFRFTTNEARRYVKIQFSGVTRLNNFMEKAAFRFMADADAMSPVFHNAHQEIGPSSIINLNSIIDLSQNRKENGTLHWNPPAGNWTILRMGFTPTGSMNHAAQETGVGLECDKFSRTAFDVHFQSMMAHLSPALDPLKGKTRISLEIDSYEAGQQNWTPLLAQEFEKKRGYSMRHYLPVLTGRAINNVDTAQRFLWDFRRTLSELMIDNYYKRFTELCHQHGFTSYVQPYERGPMEEMQIGATADHAMGECWSGLFSVLQNNLSIRRTTKLVSSIAHINGKRIIPAEAFTSEPESSRWQQDPFALKSLADKAFTKGINRLVIHRYVHQPHATAAPGMTLGPYGMEFERTNTWWQESKTWIDYLARCQTLLQQGHFVADLLYFTGEETNVLTRVNRDELMPPPPKGYDYDVIDANAILNKIKIVDNRIVLADGNSYPVLILQNHKAITLELLYQLLNLVKQGMALVGAKPERSTGLKNYIENDAAFKTVVNELWGAIDGITITKNRTGNGMVFWGMPLTSLLQQLNIQPDLECSSRVSAADINYTHRKRGDADIYFISNGRRRSEDLLCSFRVSNKQPELWDAATGKRTVLPAYEWKEGRMHLPLTLEPYGSIFVLFRRQAPVQHITLITKDNVPVLSSNPFQTPLPQRYPRITNNFSVAFWAKPEINVMLSTSIFIGNTQQPWTDFYAIYPLPGKNMYGEGHATAGITVGRNGIAVWENSTGNPVMKLSVPVAIAGWSHIALVYRDATPLVYVNGKFIQQGVKSEHIVHPLSGEESVPEGFSYYNGDMTEPVLFDTSLSVTQIISLSKEPPDLSVKTPVAEVAYHNKPALLLRQQGDYRFHYNNGKTLAFHLLSIDVPGEIKTPWRVHFPAGAGAPAAIDLPALISLHEHADDGVKYFSGTATYTNRFTVPVMPAGYKRLFLELGRVAVIASVVINGKKMGTLWKRPYRIDITDALKAGDNNVEIKVTNLWPNRLIGDEQLPNSDLFVVGGNLSNTEYVLGGGIKQLPEWYLQGKPKPSNAGIAFTTWKHYTKDSPLLESGLIGPVVLSVGVLKMV
jgi:hypothetical protein